MALRKKTYIDGVTVITGENLNDIQDAIINLENKLEEVGGEGAADLSILAPAITGSESGNPVVLSDVSPLPHELKVVVTQEGATKTLVISESNISNSGAWDANDDSLGDGEHQLVVSSVSCRIYGSDAQVEIECEDGNRLEYLYALAEGENEAQAAPFAPGDTIYVTVVSDYEISEIYKDETIEDFSGATVTKYGKNLFQYDPTDNEGSNAKVLEHGENSITLQGLAGGTPGGNVWSNGWFYIAKSGAKVTPGVTHIFSCDLTILDDPYRPTTDADKEKNGIAITPGAASSGSANPRKYYTRPSVGKKVKLYQTFTPTCDSVFFLVKTCSATIKLENFQLEVGSAYTEYEPFQEPTTHEAEESGEVNGIIGSGDSMTLIADEGLDISADYNRDPNKVFADIYQKLSALGVAVMN